MAILPVVVSAKSTFTVQVGAYTSEDEAIDAALFAENTGFKPVSVRPEQVGEKGLYYKVLVGEYETKNDASSAKASLDDKGIKGFVRSADNYDKDVVRSVIAGTTTSAYFKTPLASMTDKSLDTTFTAKLRNQRKSFLGEETTSPEKLTEYQDVVVALPDTNPTKGREIVMLGYLAGMGRSVYKGEGEEFASVQVLLGKVADGRIAATDSDRLKAQEQVAHYLHYYAKDYSEAINAYRQILAEQLIAKNYSSASNARMEIAATSFELAKVSGFDRNELQQSISVLWSDAINMQEQYLAEDSKSAIKIRQCTSRIGLMLSEIFLDLQQWSDARGIAESVISMYKDYPECKGECAEAYCHLGKIGLKIHDKSLCYASIEKAIELSDNGKPIWGDPQREPLWKAYALKNAASYYFDKSGEERDQIKQEMFRKFPGHPGLSKYFGEESK